MSNKIPWVPWAVAAASTIAFAAALPVAIRNPATVNRVVEKKIEVPVEVVKVTTNFMTNTITFTNEIPVTVEK